MKGASQLRRTLKRLPEFVTREVAEELRGSGQRLLFKAKTEAPHRTGALSAALAVKVSDKALTLKIGLITKAKRRKFFYGWILDKGRRARTVTVKRRLKAGGVTTYSARVRGISSSRYDFVFGRRQDFKTNELPRIRSALERALARAARGQK